MQAYMLRQLTFDAAMALKAEATNDNGVMSITRESAQAITGLVKAWESAVERIRIMRGRPLPGSLKPVKQSKHAKHRNLDHLGPV